MSDGFRILIYVLILELFMEVKHKGKRFYEKDSIYALGFSTISIYSIFICLRAIIYRILSRISESVILQEVIVTIGVFAGIVILRKISYLYFKEQKEKFYFCVTSSELFLSILIYVLLGYFNKEIIVLCYVLALVSGILWTKFKVTKIEFPTKKAWRNRFSLSLPVGLFWGITYLIYLPSELYLGNSEYFKVTFGNVIMPMILAFLIFEANYLVGTVFLMTKMGYLFCNIIVFTFTTLSIIQGILLNGEVRNLDGGLQNWAPIEVVINCVIWVTVLIAVIYFVHHFVSRSRKLLKIVSYGGMLIQLISLFFLIITILPRIKIDNFVLSTENSMELSDKDNVVVFVLDWFDNQVLEQILQEDSDFLYPLSGFVRYTNTTSQYAFTDLAIPFLLTGEEWRPGQMESDYAKKANEKSDVLEQISKAGYSVGVYTGASYVGEGDRSFIENGRQSVRKIDIEEEYCIMGKAARFKSMPFVLKNKFYYMDDDIYGIQKQEIEEHNIYGDIEFAKKVFGQQICVNDKADKTFRFFHLHGAHAPYFMNEDFEESESDLLTQSKASFNIVFEYIRQMKQEGLYNDATIIITADHGQNYFDRPSQIEELGFKHISSPIMFVKLPYADNTGIVVSHMPVSHKEFIPTILEATIGNTGKYGKTFREIKDENRIRKFIYGRHDDIPFVEYIINGDVMDENSWSRPKQLEKGDMIE